MTKIKEKNLKTILDISIDFIYFLEDDNYQSKYLKQNKLFFEFYQEWKSNWKHIQKWYKDKENIEVFLSLQDRIINVNENYLNIIPENIDWLMVDEENEDDIVSVSPKIRSEEDDELLEDLFIINFDDKLIKWYNLKNEKTIDECLNIIIKKIRNSERMNIKKYGNK